MQKRMKMLFLKIMFIMLFLLSTQVLAFADLPTISGTPRTNVYLGQSYFFMPAITNATSISITGKPSWAYFFGGMLSGTPFPSGVGFPDPASVGTYSNIVITATNSSGSVSLPPFSITVDPAPIISGVGTVKSVMYPESGRKFFIFPDSGGRWDPMNWSIGPQFIVEGKRVNFQLITISGIAYPGGEGGPAAQLISISAISGSGGGSGSGSTQVPVMEGWWLLPGMLAGVGIFARRRKG